MAQTTLAAMHVPAFARPLLLAGAAAALLSACGSRTSQPLSHDGYVAALHQIERSQTARDASTRFTRIVGARLSPRECHVAVALLAVDLRTMVEGVAAISPPAGAAPAHARFVAEARETVSVVERLAARVKVGTLKCGRPFNRVAYGLPSTLSAERALRELARLGYCIDTNCSE